MYALRNEMHSGRALKFTAAGSCWLSSIPVEAVYEYAVGHEFKHKAAMSRR